MRLPTLPILAPLCISAIYILTGIGSYGLLDNNEGLYGLIGLEMARGGSWIIPHVIGLPYMEKPPLLYYSIAGSIRLFGAAEWAARLPSVASAMICLAGVAWFARQLGRRAAGRLAVLILASSLGFMTMARLVMFDMLLTTCLNLALFGFWLAWQSGRRIWLRIGYGLLALAILAKGLVALVLAGLVIGAYFLIWQRPRLGELLRFVLDWPGLAIFLLIVLPWHILAAMEHPQFADFYFINEHLLRFLGKRIPHDYYSGPWWYYLPRLALFFLPWLVYALFRRHKQPFRTVVDEEDRDNRRFLWVAWVAPLLFFSLSSAKANYYLLVVMPPLALLLALHIEDLLISRARPLIGPSALLFAVLSLTAVILMIKLGTEGFAGEEGLIRIICIGTTWSMALAAFIAALTKHPMASMVSVALLPLGIGAYALHWAGQEESRFSSRAMAAHIERNCPRCEVFLFKDYEAISSLAFYLPVKPWMVDSSSNDLYFAQHSNAAPERFLTSQTLAQRSVGTGQALVVLDGRLEDFRASPLAGLFQAAGKLGRSTLFLRRTVAAAPQASESPVSAAPAPSASH